LAQFHGTVFGFHPTALTVFTFSSPELKAQVRYSDRPLSVVRTSFCKLLHFDFFSRTTGPILPDLAQIILGEGIQVCLNEGDRPSLRGDDSKRKIKHRISKKKKSCSPEPLGIIQSNLVQIILG
jgi:hypothetical protein